MKRIKFIFRWYDLWIGLYWQKKDKQLFFFPIPMLGLQINCCKHRWEEIFRDDYSERYAVDKCIICKEERTIDI